MKQEKTKKKGILIAGISAIVLIVTLGVSFAFWNYSRTTDNQVLVAGDIFMKYTETNQLVIKDALPSKEPGENDYFEFKITGKNTYNKPIWYEIVLNHGVENPEGRTERLLDKFLMFRLVETKDGVDKTVIDNASYEDITSQKIWVNTIPAETKDNIEITYKLYMWISFDTKIGNTDGNDYDMETWNNQVYASVKVSVNGDFEEKKLDGGILKDKISEKVTENNSVTDSDTGIIYLSGTNEEINFNYVRYSGKIWRVTAIYQDGKIKMLSEENLSTVGAWHVGSAFVELYNKENVIEQIGEISNKEYAKAYEKATKEDNFLVNGYYWLTAETNNPYDVVNTWCAGYRPLITLKSNLSISTGDGTKESPYELELDKEVGKINEKINTRLSGEYVKLEGKVYRIMKVEDNNSTKMISVDYVKNEDGSVMYKDFWSQNILEYNNIWYSDAVNSKNENYWGAYLNGSWLTSSLKEYLIEGTYDMYAMTDGLGGAGYGQNGSFLRWTGYVGLPEYGEIFASQLGENKSNPEEFYLITNVGYGDVTMNSSSYFPMVIQKNSSTSSLDFPDDNVTVKPTIHLKPEIIITGGDGKTPSTAYTVALPN